MKLSKLLFWKRGKSSKKRDNISEIEGNSEEPKKDGSRPRSASFSGSNSLDDQVDKKKKETHKVKRSRSLGHKTSRRNSFIRWFRASRDVGRTLRQIGDDFESNHSNSLVTLDRRPGCPSG